MAGDYREIKAWQLADKVVKGIYRATLNFPKDEVYSLTSQLRRAAISIPCNIVEGSARKHKKEFVHFLYIARGSLKETEYLLSLASEFGYLKNDEFIALQNECENCSKTLFGLIKAVSQKI